jgi:hypothetical protein
MKKIMKGSTVIVQNNGKLEVGICKKTYKNRAGTRFYDVLTERGVWFEAISDDPTSLIFVKTQNFIPLSGSLKAKIDPNKYDFTEPESFSTLPTEYDVRTTFED